MKTYTSTKKILKKTYKKSLKIETIPLKILSNLNNENNYKSVYSNNKQLVKDIIFLKKKSFDIFYSYKYKYPLLVKEEIDINTGKGNVKRADQEEPWDTDITISKKYQFNLTDYSIYEFYGGSLGHNAPASYHNNEINEYRETYLMTNISPQNVCLNTGLWNMLEIFCKQLPNNKDLFNINLFTGNIPNTHSSLFYNEKLKHININIPIYCFKIICFNHKKYPDTTFIGIILFHNKLYYIDNTKSHINLFNYLLPIKSYPWFENISNINITNLLNFYNINTNSIKSFKHIINLNLKLTAIFKKYIEYSKNTFYISKCKTLNELFELNNKIDNFETLLKNDFFLNIVFIKIRNRIIRENILYTKFTTLNKLNIFFNNFKNELNTIYSMKDFNCETLFLKYINNNESDFKELVEISNDTNLNMYYDIVKNKIINKSKKKVINSKKNSK